MHKKGHTKLHGKKVKIFEDKAGNKLFKKWMKTRGTWQWSATNNKDRLVNLKGVKTMLTKAKRSGKIKDNGKPGFWMNYSQQRGPGTSIGKKVSKSQRFLSKKPKVLSSKPLKKIYK